MHTKTQEICCHKLHMPIPQRQALPAGACLSAERLLAAGCTKIAQTPPTSWAVTSLGLPTCSEMPTVPALFTSVSSTLTCAQRQSTSAAEQPCNVTLLSNYKVLQKQPRAEQSHAGRKRAGRVLTSNSVPPMRARARLPSSLRSNILILPFTSSSSSSFCMRALT